MGKVFSSIKHPFKNFNLESRAHKIISLPKPVPAPRYKQDQETLDRLLRENPSGFEESLKKNIELEENLKNVFVTSKDFKVEVKQCRPLPVDKSPAGSFLYGIKEPEQVPIGKTTLGNILEFISKHQSDPKAYNAEKIAEKYVLDKQIVGNVLKYYKVFEIYLPQESRATKAKFAGPSMPRVEIIKHIKKELPISDTGKKS